MSTPPTPLLGYDTFTLSWVLSEEVMPGWDFARFSHSTAAAWQVAADSEHAVATSLSVKTTRPRRLA